MNFCKTGLAALLLLLSVGASAQKNFVEGYVVNNAGDTLRGLIDDKNWRMNPEAIQFRRNAEERPVTYTPADISAFHLLSGEYYRSKVVQYDQSPVALAELGNSSDPKWQRDTLFLKVEVSGKATLYFLQQKNNKQNFFLETGGAGAEELLNVKYFRFQNGDKHAVTSQQYKSQLRNRLGDCNALGTKFYEVEYDLKSFRNVIEQYNRCGGQEQPSVRRDKDRGKTFEFGLVAGVHVTRLKFSSEELAYSDLTAGTYAKRVNEVAGLSLDLVFPRAHRQYMIHSELVYKGNYVTNAFERTEPARRSTIKGDSWFRMNCVQANVMFRYHRATFTKVRPFFQAGVIAARSVGADNRMILETSYSWGGTNRTERPALAVTNRTTAGLAGGIGATWGNFGLEARYETALGPSAARELRSSVNTAYALASYTLR
ncbi:MAG: hypothetical protein AVDCRST_MAG56-1652 [uncultured Cytophagales bacterium]|uniref:Outer membrane protein beta-barrel domain-containing protein n=1 Tax=uncultured Cytophagales bacterium TaxID=158755 RepID=A0A6J4IA36_9SPHI|nr:MAG: hypothetical protein AVDCRST_MAG56-1652 [uncultured Cytophagales bacterium]